MVACFTIIEKPRLLYHKKLRAQHNYLIARYQFSLLDDLKVQILKQLENHFNIILVFCFLVLHFSVIIALIHKISY